jgi:hypothetical protein
MLAQDADYFFFAAALSALGTGILTVRVSFLVSIGAFDLLNLYGRPLGSSYLVAVYGRLAGPMAVPRNGCASVLHCDTKSFPQPHPIFIFKGYPSDSATTMYSGAAPFEVGQFPG